MRILLTLEPDAKVPSEEITSIGAIATALLREYRSMGHTVAVMSKQDFAASADRRFTWPATVVSGKMDTWKNMRALRRAVDAFAPDVVHSFSRAVYLALLLPSSVLKVISYQRPVSAGEIRWLRRLSRGTLRFTGCSEYVTTVGRRGGGKWRAIPNCVEIEKYAFVSAVAATAPLVFLGRLEPINAPHLAIAIARQAGRRLILAGERAESGAIRTYFDREIAPELGRDGIEWLGPIDHAQKIGLLSQAAALLLPIQWNDPSGLIFLEALAVGCPIISCPRGALPEIVTPGRTGFLIQNISDGLRAVAQLSTLDRGACRADAVNQFSTHVCAEQYLGLYVEMNTPIHE